MSLRFEAIAPRDTTDLDQLLLRDGRLKLLPACEYAGLDREAFRIWCHRQARYGIPTAELALWLQTAIGGRSAIEICAGNGDLAYHLLIPATDDAQQSEHPEVRGYYDALRQPPTRPGPDVRRLEALQAVLAYRPQVVIGSWVTQQSDVPGEGNYWGVREAAILDLVEVETYIHLGNRGTHGKKAILARPHEELQFPWLVSRAQRPEDDVIYVWGPRRG